MGENGKQEKILIVNADDFGLSSGVNRGIVDSHIRGILTSATLLANAPAFDEAVKMAGDHPGLGVGVHLNIVRGKPLSQPEEVPLLVDSSGKFKRFRLARLTKEFLAQAAREYRLQVRRVVEAGIRPTHIDFEKHHAWQGPLYMTACGVGAEFGVGAVRNLREPVAWSVGALGWPGVVRVAQASLLRSGFDLGGGDGGRCGLKVADRMYGQSHIGGMTEEVWLRLAERIPGGVSEVMTHPGYADENENEGMGKSWLGDGRRLELEGLVSSRVREALDSRGVLLKHYGVLGDGNGDEA